MMIEFGMTPPHHGCEDPDLTTVEVVGNREDPPGSGQCGRPGNADRHDLDVQPGQGLSESDQAGVEREEREIAVAQVLPSPSRDRLVVAALCHRRIPVGVETEQSVPDGFASGSGPPSQDRDPKNACR